MGHRHGTFGRRQRRVRDRRALIKGLFHCVFYRINQAALTFEAGRVGNRAQANAAISPDQAHRHTVATKSGSEIVSDGDRHPSQLGLLPDYSEEVERRGGSGDVARTILTALSPGQGFEPSRTPSQLFGNTFGSQRSGAARCQSNSSNGDGLTSRSERQCDEKADRLRTGVGNHSPWRNDRAAFQRGALGKP
jgi:hypothetical protein